MGKDAWLATARKPLQGLLLSLLGFGMALALWLPGWLDGLENKTWAWRVRMLAAPGPMTARIRLILLDQNSLDWASRENGLSWPWPREVYAALVAYCQSQGAKAVGFDVLFSEPSKYGVADDQALAAAYSGYGRIAQAVFLGRETGSDLVWPAGIPGQRFAVGGLAEWLAANRGADVVLPRASFPVPELATTAAVLANVHLNPDPDGIYRRSGLFNVFDGHLVPGLALSTWLAANPQSNVSLSMAGLTLAGHQLPIDARAEAILNFRGPAGTHRAYSAAAVLQSALRLAAGEEPTIREPDAWRDCYVLFGFSAPGLLDLRPTPVDGVYAGVEIQATILDNLLANDFIKPLSRGPVILAVALFCLAAAFYHTYRIRVVDTLLGFFLFMGLPMVFSLMAYRRGWWLPLIVILAGAGCSMAGALLVNYASEGRQKRFIKNAFKQYLSPAVIEELIRQPGRLQLGGERKVLSIFFSDLQGFTSISEGLSPEELTSLLNEYLSAMTDIIHEEGGTIDKYEGDAIIAFWNAPLPQADHAARAVRAAMRCQQRLAAMRPAIRQRIGRDLFMRIGLNTGPAVVGNMGSRTRFDYTMLGDAVNLAARLEGINKQFGTYTMLSGATLAAMGEEFPTCALGRVTVVGRREAVNIYEPLFPEEHADRQPQLQRFQKGLAAYERGDFLAAVADFEELATVMPPAAAYLARCRKFVAPPPAEWQGVWEINSK